MDKSEEQKSAIKYIKTLYESREKFIQLFNDKSHEKKLSSCLMTNHKNNLSNYSTVIVKLHQRLNIDQFMEKDILWT